MEAVTGNMLLERVRGHYPDPMRCRLMLLDWLFATGQGVREQALALPGGDAVCLRSSWPLPGSTQPSLQLLVLDAEPPALADGTGAAWSGPCHGLGGPDSVLAFSLLLGVLADLPRQRAVEVLWLRVPALHLAEAVPLLTQQAAPGGHQVVLQTGIVGQTVAKQQPLTAVVATVQRPRNIWRFPTCDQAVVLTLQGAAGTTLANLRQWLLALPASNPWTLHDASVTPGKQEQLRAVLRSAQPVAVPQTTATCQWQSGPLQADQRLLFPLQDVLAGLGQPPPPLADLLGPAQFGPVAVQTLPDGWQLLWLLPCPADALSDHLAEQPLRSGNLQWTLEVSGLAAPWSGAETLLACSREEAAGPVHAGLNPNATVWRLPPFLAADDPYAAVQQAERALRHQLSLIL
jgi:hypothetical protein